MRECPNQKFPLSTRVEFELADISDLSDPCKIPPKVKFEGVVIGFDPKGYFKPNSRLGFKRYKVQDDNGTVYFFGEEQLKKVK